MRRHRYRITIAGGLGEIGREAFADFAIETNNANTVLTGALDQAAWYGTLNRILRSGLGTRGVEPAERPYELRRTAST